MVISVIMLSLILSQAPQFLKPTSQKEILFVFDTSHMYLLNLYYCNSNDFLFRYLTNSVMIWQMFTLLSCS